MDTNNQKNAPNSNQKPDIPSPEKKWKAERVLRRENNAKYKKVLSISEKPIKVTYTMNLTSNA